ncbi:nickel/cobalt efflux protein RcnA [Halomonas elongata]|uniref:Nickel/cobalt efflux system n=1 Tax=Halomonas elongata TaxID=2746 RepID=A0A1B8NVF6_HALEL|nr:sodium:proton antiporter [Halomonas elongata]OBX33955.1 nickel/cobalt efflux protein RcnA [Halomonas elongata]
MHDASDKPPRFSRWWIGALLLAALLWLLWQYGQPLSLQLVAWQRDLHRALTLSISELSGAPSPQTWSLLLALSFGYGVFHAAGPGHGKAVLSTYLLTQGGALRRALTLSCAAALLQALVAIALVAVLVHGLGWLTRQALGSVVWVERASYLTISLLGAWLCWRAIRQLRHAHHHHATHDHSSCDCAHHITPTQATDWRTALLTVISIGIRPCSGAVLLVGAASLLDHFWVGVLAALTMAAGTALTVSTLALASVTARGWAERRLARQSHSGHLQRRLGWAALAGGLLILLLGIGLLLVDGTSDRGSLPLLETPHAGSQPATPRSPLGG